jgi:Ca2+-binding EF-hand superfamily protein
VLAEDSKSTQPVVDKKTLARSFSMGLQKFELKDINERNYHTFAKTKSNLEIQKKEALKTFPKQNGIKSLTLPAFLKHLIKIEDNLEKMRFSMALTEDIFLDDLFLEFDATRKGKIAKDKFRQNLKLYEIYASDEDIELIFKRYDLDRSGFLE